MKESMMSDSLSLGRRTILNVGCEVRGNVKLGDYCAVGRNVTFQGRNHEYATLAVQDIIYHDVLNLDAPQQTEDIIIGNDVWIGNDSTVLPGVSIGDGAVIGAGSVVTNTVEPFEVVGGVPAEHITWRFPEDVRAKLLEIKWWNWDEKKNKAAQATISFFYREGE